MAEVLTTNLDRQARSIEWEDPDLAALAELLETSRSIGWRAALDGVAAERPFFARRLRNLQLGNWHLLRPLPPSSTVVDVGCGFGTLALGLATYFQHVVGIDALSTRVRYANLRARQDGRDNCGLAVASGFALPLRNASADLITMNGVLEWAGLYAAGAPRRLQLSLLQELRRVLVPRGTIAVAIENRFAMETLVGMPDTHTQLRLLPALPRSVADGISRLARKRPYRTWLYSAGGYCRLLRAGGFRRPRSFDLVSSYNDYDFVVRPNDGASYRLLWERGLVRTFYARAGRARRLLARAYPAALGKVAYAFLLLAGVGEPTLLDESHAIWPALAGIGVAPGRARFGFQGTRPGTLGVVCHDGRRPTAILELAASPDARETDADSIMPASVAQAFAGGATPRHRILRHAGLTIRAVALSA